MTIEQILKLIDAGYTKMKLKLYRPLRLIQTPRLKLPRPPRLSR